MKDYTLRWYEKLHIRLCKLMGWAYRNERLGFGFTAPSKPGIVYVPYVLETSMAPVEATEMTRMLLRKRYAVTEVAYTPTRFLTNAAN